MKKGFFKKLCTVIVTAAVAVCSLSVAAFADSLFANDVNITSTEDLKTIRKWWLNSDSFDGAGKQTATSGKPETTISLDSRGFFTASCEHDPSTGKFKSVTIQGVTSADSEEWDDLETSEQKKLVQEMGKTVSHWALSDASQKKLQNQLVNSAAIPYDNASAVAALFNQGADIAGAMSWFAPFSGVVGLILGVGVVIIMVLLIFSTIMDLVYIGIPMAQLAMNSKAGKEDKEHPFGVSIDAVKVVQEKNEGTAGGNVYLKYFKRRILTYIILAICILYLVSGSLGGLISALLDMVGGIAGR